MRSFCLIIIIIFIRLYITHACRPAVSSCVSFKATKRRYLIPCLCGWYVKEPFSLCWRSGFWLFIIIIIIRLYIVINERKRDVQLIQPILPRVHGSSVGRALVSHADNPGSSPGDNVQTLPVFHLVLTYWEIKGVSISHHVYVVRDVNEPLSLEVRTEFLSISSSFHHPSLHSHK